MKTDTYNGWTNRETWLVNVWNIQKTIIHDILGCLVAALAFLLALIFC